MSFRLTGIALPCVLSLWAAAAAPKPAGSSPGPAGKFEEEKLKPAVMSGFSRDALQTLRQSFEAARKASPDDPQWSRVAELMQKMEAYDARFEPLARAYESTGRAAAPAEAQRLKAMLGELLDSLGIRSGTVPIQFPNGVVAFNERALAEQAHLIRVEPLAAADPDVANADQRDLALLESHAPGGRIERLEAAKTEISGGDWAAAEKMLGELISEMRGKGDAGTDAGAVDELAAIRATLRRFDPNETGRGAPAGQAGLLPGMAPLRALEPGAGPPEEEPGSPWPLRLAAAGAVAAVLGGLWWSLGRRS